MSLKTRMSSVVDRLITNYGFTTTLRRTTSGGIDPVTGEDTTSTADYTVTLAARSINIDRIDGTVIQSGDRMYSLTAEVEPQNGDKLQVDGQFWDIVAIQPKQVQDGDVAYIVQVRA